MDANLPAPGKDTALVTDTGTGAAGDRPAPPAAEQNLGVALLPLAVIALLVLAFVAAAWTFLASLPAA
jgi:hypothetical protein